MHGYFLHDNDLQALFAEEMLAVEAETNRLGSRVLLPATDHALSQRMVLPRGHSERNASAGAA